MDLEDNHDSAAQRKSVVYDSYNILQPSDNDHDLKLHKVGLVISSEENYSNFERKRKRICWDN